MRAVIGEDGMHKSQVNVARSVLLHDIDRLCDRPAGIHLVIHDHHIAVFDIADQGKGFRLGLVADAALLDERDRHIHVGGIIAAFLGESQIHRDDDRILHGGP